MKEGDRLSSFGSEGPEPLRTPFPTETGNTILRTALFRAGYAKVIGVQKKILHFPARMSCASILARRHCNPLRGRPAPAFRKVTLDRLARRTEDRGMDRDGKSFDVFMGSTQIPYLDIGADKGLHNGDYLRATRTYSYFQRIHPTRCRQATDWRHPETQRKVTPRCELPRRCWEYDRFLHVHPKSATVMI